MTKLHLDGVDYGYNEALALRQDLITLRGEALNQGDFSWSVKLSHCIGLFSLMGEYIWGEEWKAAMEEWRND